MIDNIINFYLFMGKQYKNYNDIQKFKEPNQNKSFNDRNTNILTFIKVHVRNGFLWSLRQSPVRWKGTSARWLWTTLSRWFLLTDAAVYTQSTLSPSEPRPPAALRDRTGAHPRVCDVHGGSSKPPKINTGKWWNVWNIITKNSEFYEAFNDKLSSFLLALFKEAF